MLLRRLSFAVLVVAVAACEKGRSSSAASRMPPANAELSQAPPVYRVDVETSRGPFVIEVHRDWSPRGADRFFQLVKSSYYDDNRFFRVVTGFVVQWGIHGDPEVSAAWEKLPIQDDSVAHSNTRGTVVFATSGPNTRSTQLFINLVDNRQLDAMGFSPFGEVVNGMAVVDSLYAGYGEGPPGGFGPDQGQIMAIGNSYLEREFPKLDFIRSARVVESIVPPGMPAAPAAGDTTKK